MQNSAETSKNLEENEDQLTFLREASRANRSPTWGKGKAPPTIETSGQNILELYKKYNQPMLLAKMFMVSSRWQMAKFMTGYFLIWRVKITKSNRTLFQLAVSKRGIAEKGLGSSDIYPNGITPTHHVPTPTATDYIERKSTNTGGPSNGELNYSTNKSVTLDRWVNMYPTSAKGEALPAEAIGGQLNPNWEEWLMGYPIGWTELKD